MKAVIEAPKVAALQMTSTAVVQDNLDKIEEMLVKEINTSEIDILVLPENFALMANHQTQYLDIAETFGEGQIQTWLSRLANQHKLWLVAGSLPIRNEIRNEIKSDVAQDKVYASCLVYNPSGDCVLRYNKVHLFDVAFINPVNNQPEQTSSDYKKALTESYQESKVFLHGDSNQLNLFETPWGNVGVSICYDIRFPEFYRRYDCVNSDSIIMHCVPAAFTQTTGRAHWEVLLRARAIENQVIIVAAGQVGEHDNQRKTWGHSMVIDAWGEIYAQQKDGQGIVFAAVSIEKLQKFRQKFPCLSHKRTYH